MSYNVDSARYISGKLTITREGIIKAIECFGGRDKLPEGGFLMEFLWTGRADVDPHTLPDGDLEVTYPGCYGDFSGRMWGHYLEALKLTKGSADILTTWEGGGRGGLRVRNGVVTEHHVVMTLGEPK